MRGCPRFQSENNKRHVRGFEGGRTWKGLERRLGSEFAPSPELTEKLTASFNAAFGSEAFANRNKDGLRFLTLPTSRQYWWVNQRRNFKPEVQGGYLWAPKTSKKGTTFYYHTNVTRIQPGDVVFSYNNGSIRAVGLASSSARDAPKPEGLEGDSDDGRKADVEFHELAQGIPLADVSSAIASMKLERGPLNESGAVTTGYLFELSEPAARVIIDKINHPPSFLVDAGPQAKEGGTMESKLPLNRILYGPPGTGKTYKTRELALEICGVQVEDELDAQAEYQKLVDSGRIRFVTFHQSFAYEDFVEGIRPELLDGSDQVTYSPRDGVFKEICDRAAVKTRRAPSYEFDSEKVRFWKMSLGNTTLEEEASVYESCIEENVIKLGYGMGLDFTGCGSRSDVTKKLKEVAPDIKKNDYNITSMNIFVNEMSEGDIVIVSDGNHKFRAIGRISGGYHFSDEGEYSQVRPVEWLRVFDPSQPREQLFEKAISQMTLYELKRSVLKLDNLLEMLRGEQGVTTENCVLIIDEINRANISKVFGELITLLEPDKRLGQPNAKRVTLPYSRELFGIPPNLYILGTMNTADRSIAFLDIALRRRFEFVELMPDLAFLSESVGVVDGIDVGALIGTVNRRVDYLFDRDHTIGHAYFLGVKTLDDLALVFRTKVIPLLHEYFYGDWEKLCLVLGCKADPETGESHDAPIIVAKPEKATEVFAADDVDYDDRLSFEVNPGFLVARGKALRPFFEAIV